MDYSSLIAQTSGSHGLRDRSSKRSATDFLEKESERGVPREADRVLGIWAGYKLREGGVVALGYPKRSAGFASGGASTEDSFDELVGAADQRTGAVADSIIDEMACNGQQRLVMAIWNRYLSSVAKFRGNESDILIQATCVFLIEAKRRGIAT